MMLKAQQDVRDKTKPGDRGQAPSSAREALVEDEAILNGGVVAPDPGCPGSEASDTWIRLSDLAGRLRELQRDPPDLSTSRAVRSETTVASLTQQETVVSIRVEVSVLQRTTQVTVAQHIDHWA